MDRITNAQLEARAASLTTLSRRLGLIEITECIVIDSAYGGVRFDVTGDTRELREQYGADRSTWPAGWSGHRIPYGYPQGHGSKRELHDVSTVALGVMNEIIAIQNTAPLAETPGERAFRIMRESIVG
jgi:hypothetical protein